MPSQKEARIQTAVTAYFSSKQWEYLNMIQIHFFARSLKFDVRI